MKEITKKWIKISDKDLEVAKLILERKYWHHAVMMSHQALEKIIKGYLAENNIHFPKTHDLPKLIGLTKLELPDDYLHFIEKINPHYQPTRYLDITYKQTFRYNQQIATDFYIQTNEISKWLKSKINIKK